MRISSALNCDLIFATKASIHNSTEHLGGLNAKFFMSKRRSSKRRMGLNSNGHTDFVRKLGFISSF